MKINDKTIGRFLASAIVLLLLPAVVNATLITIDFESDALGAQANGFASSDAPGVTFTDSVGSGLFILNVPEGDGQSLVVDGNQDLSALLIDFGTNLDFLELAFGNDDPSTTNAGDLAMLTLFLGAAEVGQVSVVLDRNDLMNQMISFGVIGGATLFDNAVFAFTDPFGNLATGGGNFANVGTTEVVDNIMFNTASVGVPVPEPSTLTLLSLGLGLILLYRMPRRRRSAATIVVAATTVS